MPNNTNPWVAELLSWHGHDRGGVRVPFHATMGRPLGHLVETSLIARLRQLASDLVNGIPDTPRWIFLIGGPGNGKSEAVEALIHELDTLAGLDGGLKSLISTKFAPDPVAPRRITLSSQELGDTILSQSLYSLTIIQDASAVDGPDHAAENALIEDIAELVTSPPESEPVFICCANRGLIARARNAIEGTEAHKWLNEPDVVDVLTQLLTSTGLGPHALATHRPKCWPLERDDRFAAWPLDLDSIITADRTPSPFEQMLGAATDQSKWAENSGCGDCSSRELCPFYTNASMLRNQGNRHELVKLLRHGELATGQRWNFRDAFSLCAELIVGQRADFVSGEQVDSPCRWVHERADEIMFGGQPTKRLSAAWELAFHLYSQALFPVWLDEIVEIDSDTVKRSPLTESTFMVFRERRRPQGIQVRELLNGIFSEKLDPALSTPPSPTSILREIEDEFGQSIEQGLDALRSRSIPVIDRLLELMALAEEDWVEIVRESRRARAIIESLRIVCATLVKRFVGVNNGEHLHAEFLIEYEATVRNSQKLRDIARSLRAILAPGEIFGGSLMRVFGQPSADATRDILVTHPLGSLMPQSAPESTDARPGHDIPWVEVEAQRIPLTFDLFVALAAYSSGARTASFPPHTRATIDKVTSAIAGVSARNRRGMLGGEVSLKIGDLGELTPIGDRELEFRRRHTRL